MHRYFSAKKQRVKNGSRWISCAEEIEAGQPRRFRRRCLLWTEPMKQTTTEGQGEMNPNSVCPSKDKVIYGNSYYVKKIIFHCHKRTFSLHDMLTMAVEWKITDTIAFCCFCMSLCGNRVQTILILLAYRRRRFGNSARPRKDHTSLKATLTLRSLEKIQGKNKLTARAANGQTSRYHPRTMHLMILAKRVCNFFRVQLQFTRPFV